MLTSLIGFTNPLGNLDICAVCPIDQGPTNSKQYFLDLYQNIFQLSTLGPKCCFFTLKHGAIRRMGNWSMNSGSDTGLLWHLRKLLVPQKAPSHMLNAFLSTYFGNIEINLVVPNTALYNYLLSLFVHISFFGTRSHHPIWRAQTRDLSLSP